MIRFSFALIVLLVLNCAPVGDSRNDVPKGYDGMVLITGGTFIMGTSDPQSYDHERPAHNVTVRSYWIDETEVTNAQFKEFVDATGYVTIAERVPVWEDLKKQVPEGTPKPPDSLLVPGSLVFF